MHYILKIATLTLLGLGLAGCGQSFEDDLLDQLDRYNGVSERVGSMSQSGPRVVDNTSGTARFSGGAYIAAGQYYNATLLVGDANLTVNFDGRTNITGSITNVAGLAGTNLDIAGTGRLDSYDGRLALSNGSVGAGNQLSFDYAGTLRGNGDVLTLGGTMDGSFRGNPQIRALTASDRGLGYLNGGLTSVDIGIVAERD